MNMTHLDEAGPVQDVLVAELVQAVVVQDHRQPKKHACGRCVLCAHLLPPLSCACWTSLHLCVMHTPSASRSWAIGFATHAHVVLPVT